MSHSTTDYAWVTYRQIKEHYCGSFMISFLASHQTETPEEVI